MVGFRKQELELPLSYTTYIANTTYIPKNWFRKFLLGAGR